MSVGSIHELGPRGAPPQRVPGAVMRDIWHIIRALEVLGIPAVRHWVRGVLELRVSLGGEVVRILLRTIEGLREAATEAYPSGGPHRDDHLVDGVLDYVRLRAQAMAWRRRP